MADPINALLGVAFQEFVRTVVKNISITLDYEKNLEGVKNILECFKLLVSALDTLGNHRSVVQQRTCDSLNLFLIKGTKLVTRCSRPMSCAERWWYSKKLIKLEKKLCKFVEIQVAIYTSITSQETCLVAQEINIGVTRFEEGMKHMQETILQIGNLSKKVNGGVERLEEGLSDFRGIIHEASICSNETKMVMERMEKKFDGIIPLVHEPRVVYNEDDAALRSTVGCQRGSECVVPNLPKFLLGLDIPLRGLKDLLFRDGISCIGVCGVGGSGKTTLVSQLCQDENVKAKFQIVFLMVSSKPDMKEIIRRYLERVSPSNNGYIFTSDEDAVVQLQNKMESISRPILVILDDVWSGSVIKKLHVQRNNVRTIVTSREELKECNSIYTMEPFKEADAVKLFRHHAGNDSMQRSHLEKQIVNKCHGLPLVIEVIGSSLYKQDQMIWQDTARKLNVSICNTNKDILDRLKASVEALSEEHKKCFLDLGCFPEDKNIPAASLIDIWSATYGFDEASAYAALRELSRRHLITMFDRLSDEAGRKNGSFSNLYVTQHDLLRDLAIQYVKNVHGKNDGRLLITPKLDGVAGEYEQFGADHSKAKFVSIEMRGTDMNMWTGKSFPRAEVLVLNFVCETCSLPTFLRNMKKLKVLVLLNYSSSHMTIDGQLPSSSLANLRIIRFHMVSLSVSSIFAEPLQVLQKLSLASCEIKDAESFADLDIPHIFPSLTDMVASYCSNLETLPPTICEAENLQSLRIMNCPDLVNLPASIGKLRSLKILKLQGCTGLQELPDSIGDLQDLEFLDLCHCSIDMLPDTFGNLSNLKAVDLRYCPINKLPETIRNMNGLEDVICDENAGNMWNKFKKSMKKHNLTIEVRKQDPNLNFLRS